MTPPIALEDAIARCRALAPDTGVEVVPVRDVSGRVLAAPVTSAGDIPAFTNSALDGYALRAADTPGHLSIGPGSRAGAPGPPLARGGAAPIATGAVIPDGADAVLRIEHAVVREGALVVDHAVPVGTGVRYRGDDATTGTPLLAAGHCVRRHEIAMIAGTGNAQVLCRVAPAVVVIVTGDEIRAPGAVLAPGQVWDAVGVGVPAVMTAAGAHVLDVVHVGDDPSAVHDALATALGHPDIGPDVVVTVGGISVGAHDHVRAAIIGCGADVAFHGVASRPGQPALVATRGRQVILGLPGNPVSAIVVAMVLGRPLLGHGSGWSGSLPLAHDHHGPVMDRVDLIRCRIGDGGLEPLPRQGSHQLSSLAGSDVLAWVPPGSGVLPAGTLLRVEWLPGG